VVSIKLLRDPVSLLWLGIGMVMGMASTNTVLVLLESILNLESVALARSFRLERFRMSLCSGSSIAAAVGGLRIS
jgi:hypothetical protein